jgi:phospholipid-translocating ATPase
MVFRECSIGGKVYSGDPADDLQDTPLLNEEPEIKHVDRSISVSPGGSRSGSSTQRPSSEPNPIDDTTTVTTAAPLKVHHKFHDTNLSQDLRAAVHVDRETDAAPHARALNGFFTVLALCHTVLAATDPVTGAVEYKAQSPDEAALVRAAADVGYVFKGRELGDVLVLQTPFGEERYELLNILEFTSVRKRMSVVVRRVDEGVEGGDRRLFLLCKGADNVVFERLKQGGGPAAEDLKEITERHLGEFASQGLRTLTLAYKVIPGGCIRFLFVFVGVRY